MNASMLRKLVALTSLGLVVVGTCAADAQGEEGELGVPVDPAYRGRGMSSTTFAGS
jgi:hypothetical protein